MPGKWKTIIRIAGFLLIAGGAFAGLSGPWPWVLMMLGLALIVISGGPG